MIPAAVQRVFWCILALVVSPARAEPDGSLVTNQPAAVSRSRFRSLVVAESGGHHVAFTQAARPWLIKLGEENGFALDHLSDTSPLTTALLARYQLVLQLDFVPYGWKPEARRLLRPISNRARVVVWACTTRRSWATSSDRTSSRTRLSPRSCAMRSFGPPNPAHRQNETWTLLP